MVAPVVAAAGISALSNLAGSLIGGGDSNNHAGRDQRQAISFANQSAILDKVKAAKKAGISPLYALGAPAISGPGVNVGSSGGPSLGQTISEMGADVSRAVAAGQTAEERALQALTFEKAALENDYLREQIASVRARTARESGPAIRAVPGLIPERVQAPQRTTGANVMGGAWESAPGTSDLGQIIEDRYGEGNPLSWPLGGLGMVHDYWWNVYSPSNPKSSASRTWNWLTGK